MSQSRLVVKVFDESQFSAEKLLPLSIIDVNEEYSDYLRDESGVTVLYAIAHDLARKYQNQQLVVSVSHDNEVNVKDINRVFSAHPRLLPNQVTLQLISQDSQFEIRGEGGCDQNYPSNAAYLLTLSALVCPNGQPSVYTANNVDFEEYLAYCAVKSGSPALAVMLDADNCIYNYKFSIMLMMLNLKFGEAMTTCLAGQQVHQTDLTVWCERVINEIASIQLDSLTDDLIEKLIIATNQLKQAFDADLKGSTQLARFDRYLTVNRQFIRHLNKISPGIVAYILYRANESLFDKMINDALHEKCSGIILMVGSARQSIHEDKINSKANGTGSFLHDLHQLTLFLNRHYRGKMAFMLDRFLLADAYNELPHGESYKRALTDSTEHGYSVLDASKTSMVLVFMHHIKNHYPGTMLVQFCDDRSDILTNLKKIFHDDGYHSLLPKDLPLQMIPYDGEFLSSEHGLTLTGSGELNTCVYRLVRLIAEHSGLDLSSVQRGPVNHNIGLRLNFEIFAISQAQALVDSAEQPHGNVNAVAEPQAPQPEVRRLNGLFRTVVLLPHCLHDQSLDNVSKRLT